MKFSKSSISLASYYIEGVLNYTKCLLAFIEENWFSLICDDDPKHLKSCQYQKSCFAYRHKETFTVLKLIKDSKT